MIVLLLCFMAQTNFRVPTKNPLEMALNGYNSLYTLPFFPFFVLTHATRLELHAGIVIAPY